MMLSRLILTSGLAIGLVAGGLGAVSAQTPAAPAVVAPVQPVHKVHLRGEHRSDHSIRYVRRRLERLIDNLQHDRHDYAGHRLAAISSLQQARAELLQAEQTPEAKTK